MKNALSVLLLLFFPCLTNVFSQTYSLNNGFTSGGQVRSCSGIFKDSNPFGAYGNNENYRATFNTASPTNQALQFDFDTLDIARGDTLFIFDGPSVNAPLLTTLTYGDGAPLSVRASAANPGGSITILFQSNSGGTASGWSANLACKSPCQKIDVKLNTIPAADENGFINICKGDEVQFSGAGTYSQNNIFYHQSDSTAKFLWSFSDGRDTTGIFAHTITRKFTGEGGTIVQLALMDDNECYNFTATQVKVRTSLTPTFNINPQEVCINDTVMLVARSKFPEAIFSNLPVYSDSKPLADGIGKCYETSINITKFLPGQKLTSLSDLDGILINMEHSWLGDFTIAITAPNGAKVYLKKAVGTNAGWETFLGEPVDEPSLNSPLASMPGKGYDYLFSPSPQYGTMEKERGKYIYSYVDNAGQSLALHPYLPAGSYAPEESLTGLLGTTLNGLWTIEVCDNFKEDNGFIFYWTIKLKPSVYPDSEIYTTRVSSQQWLGAAGLVSAKDSAALISSPAPGKLSYKYSVTDNFGCIADTSVQVNVNALPLKPELGADTVLCTGQIITLQIKNPQPNDLYKWSTGEENTSSIQVSAAGTYQVKGTNNNGCSMADTIVVVNSALVSISVGKDTLFCASSPNVLTSTASANVTSVVWNTGSTGASVTATQAGIYWATGKTASGCAVTDSIQLLTNPANNVRLPNDTTICEGTNLPLTLAEVTAGVSLVWNDGHTGNSHLVEPGKYAITATYRGCIKTDEIVVGTRPIPVVSLGADTVLCTGFDLPLTASYPGANFLWSTGTAQNNVIARQPGTYWVQSTLNGCTYRDSMVFTQRPCSCNVKLPNAFSPNGDGINDLYKPEISCFPKDYRFSVFNRYGQLLFSSTEYQNGWNGTVNGKGLPVGTYYYILSFFNVELQRPEQFKGSITLLK